MIISSPPAFLFSGICRRHANRWYHVPDNYTLHTAYIHGTSLAHCPVAQRPADSWTPVWFRSFSIRHLLKTQKGRSLWFLKSSGLADLIFCCQSKITCSCFTSRYDKSARLLILWNQQSDAAFRYKTNFNVCFSPQKAVTRHKVPVEGFEALLTGKNGVCHQWKNKKFSGPFEPGKPWWHCVWSSVIKIGW